MKDNPLLVFGGILLVILLIFLGYKIIAVSVGPVTVSLEKPAASNQEIIPTVQQSGAIESTMEPVMPTPNIPKHALPGVYNMEWVLSNNSMGWIVTLSSIEIYDNGQFKVNVTWRNNNPSSSTINCDNDGGDDARAHLVLQGGVRVFPLETFCTSRRGQEWEYAAGATWTEWAIYPPLDDASTPFDLVWYSIGTANGVVLPNGN